MRRGAALLILFATLTLSAAELRVRQVVVFKNGIGFLSRTGKIEFRDGRAEIGKLPPATYGGLWVTADGGMRIEEAVASKSSSRHAVDAATIADLLDANDGRQVTLRLDDTNVTGTLHSRGGSTYAFVESSGRTTAVPKSEVRSLAADGTLSQVTTKMETEGRLELRAETGGSHQITVASLEKAIGWTPEYAVVIGSDGRATVSLRATLINDATDLDDAEVWFAIGYPSFKFAEVRGPLDPSQELTAFLRSLTTAGWSGGAGPLANVMTQAVSLSTTGSGAPIELPDSLTEGERQQDLYLYRKNGVSLKVGERGAYPLMELAVPYSHTWDWDVEQRSPVTPYGYAEGGEREEILDRVWHSIELENRSDVPWTTGPALVIEAGRPLAQNTLHYTPSGGRTRLPLTVASDIAARHTELEKGRVAEPMRRFGHTYEGIDYEGTLSITNHRKDAVTVDARRRLTGSVISVGDGGRAVRLAEEPSAINPQSKLEWSIPVAPGETRTVNYQFRVWVRR